VALQRPTVAVAAVIALDDGGGVGPLVQQTFASLPKRARALLLALFDFP
jgi:hypothetical protein